MKKTVFLLFLLFGHLLSAQSNGVNAPEHLEKPYVILISLDGFRHDYVARWNPPNLKAFAETGVQAESLIPCFPSKTFPNHYSIATGMYPENHDLVDNRFYDPARKMEYRIGDRSVVEDGTWYKGTPIWVNAEKQGMVSASFFFVGSEANIQGVFPTYYTPYDGSIPNEKRIEQALEWLKMPAEKRPHLITLYFSDMDDAGHRYGPNHEKTQEALMALDRQLGVLFEGVEATGLPVNILFVSDHGMAEITVDRLLNLHDYTENEWGEIVSNGALIHVYLQDKTKLDAIYQEIKAKETHFKVYKTTDSPYYSRNRSNPRLGDLLLVADHPYYFSDARRILFLKARGSDHFGEHGLDPVHPDMHGIFYAKGPQLASQKIPSFENIHIYPLICQLLDLPIPEEVDGEAEVLAPILKK